MCIRCFLYTKRKESGVGGGLRSLLIVLTLCLPTALRALHDLPDGLLRALDRMICRNDVL